MTDTICNRFRAETASWGETRYEIDDEKLLSYWCDEIVPAVCKMTGTAIPGPKKHEIISRTARDTAGYPGMATHVLRANAARILDLDYESLTDLVKGKSEVNGLLQKADDMKEMGRMDLANALWAKALKRVFENGELGRLAISIREEATTGSRISDGHHDLAYIQGYEAPDVCIPIPMLKDQFAYWFAAHAQRRQPVEHDRETTDEVVSALPALGAEAWDALTRYLENGREIGQEVGVEPEW
jgi:hypothetical protein